MPTITVDTSSYNARRYGKPWIAKVDFSSNPKGDFAWGSWVGTVNGGNGSVGTLVIDAQDGDIVAKGQKDFRGRGTECDYYQVRDGQLAHLVGGKAEAYKLATATG